MNLFRNKTFENGIYKEVYVYFRGALIYKAWFVKGKKTFSRMFHYGEGLTQFSNSEIAKR
ncbi:hypothetical protein BEN49_23865 [Hymenobacter coccineus]|uniref:Uncharacterized protein n=1 Tax=Hymenobacter coccineus TaxID=1908235 RepID=A0A1G1TGX6_9BACT|nr:hypothetical protein BEN49_23865 [Hymenobacter coccineus]